MNICQCIFLIIRFYIPVEKGFTIEQTWIPFTRGWFVPSLFGNRPSDSGEEDFKILTMYFSYFVIIPPPLEMGVVLYFNKIEFLSSKDALCQDWLKLTLWFLRRRRKCEKFTEG